jgi:hypothetical protein
MYQMRVNIPNILLHFHFLLQGSPKYTQSGIFGMKIYHLATLMEAQIKMSQNPKKGFDFHFLEMQERFKFK